MKTLLVSSIITLAAGGGFVVTGLPGDGDGPRPTPPNLSTTTTTTLAPDSDSDSDTAVGADAGALQIALEIHVENSADPAAEMETVAQLAAAATENDIVITFSLDEAMVEYLAAADEAVLSVVRAIEDDGHQFGLHADLASMDQRAATMHLAGMTADYRTTFGHAPLSLSGACTAAGDWIAAARANGITVIAGVVVYCERSLDATHYADTVYADEIARANAACSRPARANCHDPAPQADEARRVQPWLTDSARRWLDESARVNALTIVPTLGDTSMECASEGASGSCSFDADGDAAAFVDLAVLAASLSAGAEGATLHMAWSTNNRPSEDYIDAVFAAIANSIDEVGAVSWATLAAV